MRVWDSAAEFALFKTHTPLNAEHQTQTFERCPSLGQLLSSAYLAIFLSLFCSAQMSTRLSHGQLLSRRYLKALSVSS